MRNDKMREEFEVAIAAYVGISVSDITRCRKEETYTTDALYYAWWAWQASREALVIELPDDGIEDCRKEWPERGEKYSYDTFDTGYLYACKKHEQAIEAAGLKVSQ